MTPPFLLLQANKANKIHITLKPFYIKGKIVNTDIVIRCQDKRNSLCQRIQILNFM
jgi:hypothetical protein